MKHLKESPECKDQPFPSGRHLLRGYSVTVNFRLTMKMKFCWASWISIYCTWQNASRTGPSQSQQVRLTGTHGAHLRLTAGRQGSGHPVLSRDPVSPQEAVLRPTALPAWAAASAPPHKCSWDGGGQGRPLEACGGRQGAISFL